MLGWNKIQSLMFNSMQNVDYICYIYIEILLQLK